MAGYIGETKYVGPEAIVVAMDIGTTQSAACFTYFYPGDYPRACMVKHWGDQDSAMGSSKIPTLVAYKHRECKACGPDAEAYVDDDDYEVAKWFKLRLHPKSMHNSDLPPPYGSSAGNSHFEMPALPTDVSVQQVYMDFMKYIMENVQKTFASDIPNGGEIWKRLRDTMFIVLTTPNGWDLAQQGILRKAAIAAGLVISEKAHQLLDFVTEGEASVHYALAHSHSKSWLVAGSLFAVIDAGGSTVDSTLYECKFADPNVHLEEVCPSECVQAGGIFIDRAAEKMLRENMRGSNYEDGETIAEMMIEFERRTKRMFDGSNSPNVVKFGGTKDNDRSRGIFKGKLSISRYEMELLFDGVVKRMVENCLVLLKGHKVKYILLVGGFGDSRYLQKRLAEIFDRQGVEVVKVKEEGGKAAAVGALIWYAQKTVMARVARSTIGTKAAILFWPLDPEHFRRSRRQYSTLAGTKLVPGAFSTFVTKGQRLGREFTSTRTYNRLYPRLGDDLGSFTETLEVWEGTEPTEWVDDVCGIRLPQMRELCTLRANLSGLRNTLTPQRGPKGLYYKVEFAVVLSFGGTQLQARLQWKEGDMLREGPVTIIPNAIL